MLVEISKTRQNTRLKRKEETKQQKRSNREESLGEVSEVFNRKVFFF